MRVILALLLAIIAPAAAFASAWAVQQQPGTAGQLPECNLNNGNVPMDQLGAVLSLRSAGGQTTAFITGAIRPPPPTPKLAVRFTIDGAKTTSVSMVGELNDITGPMPAPLLGEMARGRRLTLAFADTSYDIDLSGFDTAYADFRACVDRLGR